MSVQRRMLQVLLLGALAAPAGAQQPQTGVIIGKVAEANMVDKPMANVYISLIHVTQGAVKFSGSTNFDGKFIIKNVPVGKYTATAKYIGFAQLDRPVEVKAGDTVTVDFAMHTTPNVLNTVVVTGTIAATARKDIPTTMTVVTAKDIEDKGITNIVQLFQGAIPSVFVQYSGPYDYYATVKVRGVSSMYTQSLKLYIDGVEVASDGYAFASLDPTQIERIEILRGPQATTVYGSGASTGVMQVFTKKGAYNNPRPRIDMTLSSGFMETGLHNHLSPQHQYLGTIQGGGDEITYSMGGNYQYTGDWAPGYKTRFSNYYGGFRGRLGAFSSDFSARFNNRLFGSPSFPIMVAKLKSGVYDLDANPWMEYYLYPQTWTYDILAQTYGTQLQYQSGPYWQHSVTLGYDRSQFGYNIRPKYQYYWDTLWNQYFWTNGKSSILYSNTIAVPLGGWFEGSMVSGLDYQMYEYRYTYSSPPMREGRLSNRNIYKYGYAYDQRNGGYFMQMTLKFFENLSMVGGMRMEDNPGFGDELSWWQRTAPRVGLAYSRDFENGLTAKVRSSYGVAFQPPTENMKRPISSSSTTYLFNEELRPERSQGGEWGLELFFGSKGSLIVTYYDQTAKDLISLSRYTPPNLYPAVYKYENIGAIRNQGWELEGMAMLWRFQLNGSYSKTSSIPIQFVAGYTGYEKVGTQFTGVPLDNGSVSLTYRDSRAQASVDANIVGQQYGLKYSPYYDRYYLTGRPNTPPTFNYYDYYLPTYANMTMNMNGTYTFNKHVQAFARIQNLLNNQRDFSYDAYVRIGRTSWLGMRLHP